jgi:hypothetical protein
MMPGKKWTVQEQIHRFPSPVFKPYGSPEAVVTILIEKLWVRKRVIHQLGRHYLHVHDRAVAKEADILTMNPVYPSMLAFAERSWRGGGHDGWTSIIGEPNSYAQTEFGEFESRLLDHRQRFFSNSHFLTAGNLPSHGNCMAPMKMKEYFQNHLPLSSKDFDENIATAAIQATGRYHCNKALVVSFNKRMDKRT